MPTTSRKPKEFLFVDQSISSTSRSRREIELQDAARRAHAARNSRPQRPISSPDGPHSSKPSLSYRSKPHKSKNASSNPPLPAEQQLIVRSKLSGEAQSGATTVAIPRPIDSIIRLGQGHGDPFDTAAIAHLPGFIYDILDYSYHSVWPSVMCADPQDAVTQLAPRRRVARENPFVLHAQIVNSSGTRLHLIRPDDKTRTVLRQANAYHERKALEEIVKILEATPGPPPDAVVLALTLIIWPPGPYNDGASQYPESPMARAQNLDLYSNMEITPKVIRNVQWFYRLLEPRGGLEGLSLRGQVNIVNFADIFVSSRLGVRPLWPWPSQLRYALDLFQDLVLDPHAFQLSLVTGHGFSVVKNVQLRAIWTLAGRATLALDLYHRKAPFAPQVWELCPARNAVQHHLCSLDPPSHADLSHDDAIDDVVRLALLIYSDFVLFPISDATSIKPRLAYDLRTALVSLESRWVLSAAERELVTWCTTMGAMASFATVHQELYIARLAQALHDDPRLLDWILFQTLMSHFLWWDHVLQPRCWEVWVAATRSLKPGSELPMRESDDAVPRTTP